MKIGIILYPTYGGSGVVATELGKALAEQGHEIHFITYSVPVRLGSFKKNIYYHEVNVATYPLFNYPPYELALTSKIVDVVKYEKLDLLHAHYAIPHASAAYMAKQILKKQGIAIPYITTLHGTDITLVGKESSFEPVITFSINESDAVTSVSESLKKDTYEHFDIKKDIEVIPNFICLEKSRDFNFDKLSYAPNGEKIVTHISNFRKVKRVDDVAKIFKNIQEKVPSVLLMVGDGPERGNIEKYCREFDICDKVKFLGNIKSIPDILEISDLFLLPSETESFGLAALEAMLAKVPVISSNTGGIPEVNSHGFSGYLSNVGDIEEMSRYSIEILSDDKKLDKFKKQAFIQASKFDIKRILPMYIDLYNRVTS